MGTEGLDRTRRIIQTQMNDSPRLEEKVESNSNKILYLVKRINQLSKSIGTGSHPGMSQERIMRLAERLRDKGIVVEYTDARGVLKLKGVDRRGLDNIKKLSAHFMLEMVECWLENEDSF